MAILRPCGKFVRILTKITTNCQTQFVEKLISNPQFRGYVYPIHSATYCYFNSEKKEWPSVNNCKKTDNNNINKNVVPGKLEHFLEILNPDFHNMKVDYDVLLNTLKIYAESTQDIDDKIGIFLLNCCGEVLPDVKYKLRQELTDRVWEMLNKKNSKMSLPYYHTYLNVCAQNYANIEPEEFINNMKIMPDANIYRCLLNVAAKNGNSDGVNFVLMKMKEFNYSVNHEMLSALIELCSRKGDMESVNSVFETIISSGITTQEEFYGDLAWGYGIQNDIQNILKLLESHSINDKYLLLIIKTLSLSGNGKDIEKIFKFFSREKMVTDPLLHNIVIELVHSEKLDDALLIVNFFLNNFSRTETIHLIKHFLRAIVHATIPNEIVLKIGREFNKIYASDMILHVILEQSLRLCNKNLSILILEEMRNEKIAIRPHYYWPLLKQACENQGETGIFKVIQHMEQLHVPFDYNTLLEYVIPYINISKPRNTLSQLTNYGIPMPIVFKSLICYLLQNGQLAQTLSLCDVIKNTNIEFDILSLSLIEAYKITQDVESCIKVLKVLGKGPNHSARFLLQLVFDKSLRNDIVNTLKKFINAYSKHRLWISSPNAELIEEALACNYGSANRILDSLSFSPIVEKNRQQMDSTRISAIPHPREMSEEQLENHLCELESKQMNTRGALRKLFMLYCKNNNFERVEQLKRRLDNNNMSLTFGMKASLLQLYARNDRIAELNDILSDLKQNHPSSIIDAWKIIGAATALVNQSKVEMALDIINDNGHANFECERDCWKLLNAIARSSHAHLTDSTLELLVKNGYCHITRRLLGPLVRQHLLKNDIPSAVDAVKRAASQYGEIPLRQEIVCTLVEMSSNNTSDNIEVESMLQDVLNLIAKIHGEETVEMELIMGYARCGMSEKLRTTLENLKIFNALAEQFTMGMTDEIKLQILTTILEASRGITHIQRHSICELVLSTYCDMAKCQDAINLWQKMKNEGIIVSSVFKRNFLDLLSRHKVQIPPELGFEQK